jgi:hypothetical protein
MSIELSLLVRHVGSGSPVLVPADRDRNVQMDNLAVVGPEEFLGRVTNIPAHRTARGYAAFMFFENSLKAEYGVEDMRQFTMDVPRQLVFVDKVSGKERIVNVPNGGIIVARPFA